VLPAHRHAHIRLHLKVELQYYRNFNLQLALIVQAFSRNQSQVVLVCHEGRSLCSSHLLHGRTGSHFALTSGLKILVNMVGLFYTCVTYSITQHPKASSPKFPVWGKCFGSGAMPWSRETCAGATPLFSY